MASERGRRKHASLSDDGLVSASGCWEHWASAASRTPADAGRARCGCRFTKSVQAVRGRSTSDHEPGAHRDARRRGVPSRCRASVYSLAALGRAVAPHRTRSSPSGPRNANWPISPTRSAAGFAEPRPSGETMARVGYPFLELDPFAVAFERGEAIEFLWRGFLDAHPELLHPVMAKPSCQRPASGMPAVSAMESPCRTHAVGDAQPFSEDLPLCCWRRSLAVWRAVRERLRRALPRPSCGCLLGLWTDPGAIACGCRQSGRALERQSG